MLVLNPKGPYIVFLAIHLHTVKCLDHKNKNNNNNNNNNNNKIVVLKPVPGKVWLFHRQSNRKIELMIRVQQTVCQLGACEEYDSVHLAKNIRAFLKSGIFFLNAPVRVKTDNLGFRPGPTKTTLYSHRSRLEARNF